MPPKRQKQPTKTAARAKPALTPAGVESWMEARGVRQASLARATGVDPVRLHRWLRGKAKLSGDQLGAVAAYIESFRAATGGGEGGDLEEMGSGEIAVAMRELAFLAGSAAELDEKDLVRALARQHTAAAVGGLVKLAVSAKNEGVRLRAYELLLDRGYGKPPQHIVDSTPRPPARDEELLLKLHALVGEAPAEPLPAAEDGGGDRAEP